MNTLKLEVRVSSPVEIPTVSFKAKLISSKDKEVLPKHKDPISTLSNMAVSISQLGRDEEENIRTKMKASHSISSRLAMNSTKVIVYSNKFESFGQDKILQLNPYIVQTIHKHI